MYTTKQKGFTIVELLIVIVVIAILAAISIVAFTGVQQRGRDANRTSDTSNIAKALTAHTSEEGAWPTNATEAITALNDSNASVTVPADVTAKLGDTAASSNTPDTDVYGYERCPATGTQTGATISWIKEADGSTQTATAGSC